ncbi:8-oxoguanine DNA glycosylase OGG fold protein [Streptomyces rochei]
MGGWWGQNAVRLTDGTPGAHTVRYTSSRWAHITTWPSMMASTFQAGDADVSRTQVASIVADALERGAYEEALVATYVWGKGKSGSPAGSGPATLHKILLGTEGLNAILASVVNTLREQDAEAAYAELRGRIAGFGPSFYSKFLYFAGKSVRAASGTQPLILDQVLARRMRSLAQAVCRETGYDPDGSIARWVWRDTNWSPHRYAIYLSLHAGGFPSGSSNSFLALRCDARPARVRAVQDLVDRERRGHMKPRDDFDSPGRQA